MSDQSVSHCFPIQPTKFPSSVREEEMAYELINDLAATFEDKAELSLLAFSRNGWFESTMATCISASGVEFLRFLAGQHRALNEVGSRKHLITIIPTDQLAKACASIDTVLAWLEQHAGELSDWDWRGPDGRDVLDALAASAVRSSPHAVEEDGDGFLYLFCCLKTFREICAQAQARGLDVFYTTNQCSR